MWRLGGWGWLSFEVWWRFNGRVVGVMDVGLREGGWDGGGSVRLGRVGSVCGRWQMVG